MTVSIFSFQMSALQLLKTQGSTKQLYELISTTTGYHMYTVYCVVLTQLMC